MEKRVTIAGRELKLKYTVNALCAVEERAGAPLDEMMARQFSAVRLLLWGGLAACRPETTLQEAGEMMDEHIRAGGTLEEIAQMCMEAMEDAGFIAPPSD